MENRWKKEEDKIIINNYSNISSFDIHNILKNRSVNAIRSRARKLKIKSKYMKGRNFHDVDFFKVPNSLNSYWAGFIAADGCLTSTRKCLSISLSIKDKDHLELFKKTIKGTSSIGEFKGTKSCYYRIYNCYNYYNDLYYNFSITSKKSLTLIPPNIKNKDLVKSFIIGYIDGDGYIRMKRTKSVIEIIGTHEVLSWINNQFSEFYGLSIKTVRKIKHSKAYSISYHTKQAKKIYYDLKRVPVPKLHRKWSYD